MKILVMVFYFLAQFAFAQGQQFQLKGSLGKNTSTKEPVEFTLNWHEKDGLAEGTYEDNFYAKSATFKGISGANGRIFVVTLPKETYGVRTISFLSSDLKGSRGKALIPVSVVMRDDKGNPVTTKSIDANISGMSDLMAQRQEGDKCSEGFGELAGFCGEYTGMITEEMDTQERCNLLAFNNARLILDENAELGLVLGETSEIVSTPVHRIGRMLVNSANTNVDVISRSCRPLVGTTFPGDNCKRLNLVGSFSNENGKLLFTGKYTITDERTNQSCRYSLAMNQDV